MIKAYLTNENEWDLNLGCLAYAYRSTANTSTKLKPNLLCIRRKIQLPADLIYGTQNSYKEPPVCTTCRGHKKENAAHDVGDISSSAKRNKAIYESKQVLHHYSVGNLVWYLLEIRSVGVTPKLQKKYDGPFLRKEVRAAINFVFQVNEQGQGKQD